LSQLHNKDYETGNLHLLVGLGSLHNNNNRSYEMTVECCPTCRAEFSDIRNVAMETSPEDESTSQLIGRLAAVICSVLSSSLNTKLFVHAGK
jgi:hypothetical protein